MATKGKRPMRTLTASDKIHAIQRVNDGESKASVARDIGVPESTLRGWCKNEDKLRYMTSRLSSPDTDKSNDCERPEKRARTESPAVSKSPTSSGLDLTATAVPSTSQRLPLPVDAPVELTTKRCQPSTSHSSRDYLHMNPGSSVPLNASSPLTNLSHVHGLSNPHALGINPNELLNFDLLAQMKMNALSTQPSKNLRLVRAKHDVINTNEINHRSKSQHNDNKRNKHHSSKNSHQSTPTVANSLPTDPILIWAHMMGINKQSTTTHQYHLPKYEQHMPDPTVHPKPALAQFTPIDYNNILWKYCRTMGGAIALPEDQHKPALQVPKEKPAEKILYTQLTKGKEQSGSISPRQGRSKQEPPRVAEPVKSPGTGAENKEPITEQRHDQSRNATKARTVLDILFKNSNHDENKVARCNPEEWESGAAEALEHGDKFLAWLETSGNPSVTQIHVHQLRSLLHNLRTHRPSARAVNK